MKTKCIFLVMALFTSVYLFGQVTLLTTYDFETEEKIFFNDNNLWEIGIPSKNGFDKAYSGNRAIITDSLSAIPGNTHSSFYIVLDSAEICDGNITILEFWHKYEMDKNNDTAFVDFSYDGGSVWHKGNQAPYDYPMRVDHERYFESNTTTISYPDTIITGNSGGWVKDKYEILWWVPIKSTSSCGPVDSTIVRFNMKTGQQNQQNAGWMIDDISISTDFAYSIHENTLDDLSIFPNPFHENINIELGESRVSKIEFYNTSGQSIEQLFNVNAKKICVDTEDWKEGCYLMRIYDNDGRWGTKTLIKK